MAPEPSGLCRPCARLQLTRSDFTDPPFKPEGKDDQVVLTGTLAEIRAEKERCKLCDLLWYALHRNEGSSLESAEDATKWHARWRQNATEYDPVGESVEDMYGSGLYPQLEDNQNCSYSIQLVDDKATEDFLRGRMIGKGLDIGMVQAWLSMCREEHGERCKESYMESKEHPAALPGFMVIDVQSLRLESLPPGAEYTALSYVWGKTNHPVSLSTTISGFKKPNGLSIGLPKTIQDAIFVTRQLGFSFLWIDSLCIVQDDTDAKMLLISNMDAIYSHATMTLVAASGKDAQSGISGVSGHDQRELHTQELAPGLRLGVLPSFEEDMMQSDHARRAWTYQETCLSPRCLVFLNGLVFFACRGAVWGEHINAEFPNVRPAEGANTLGKNEDPEPLRRLQQHVTAFASRSLTYQSDGLNAFSGIASAMSRYMGHTKMLFGLPASVFDWAILWTTTDTMKRREGFPAWSWVGWEGWVLMAVDTDSEYDQKWLLKGTWIDWFIINDIGEAVQIWDPERDGSTPSPLVAAVLGTGEDEPHEESLGVGKEEQEEKEEEKEEEEEDVACPTYGWPSQSSPYGRRLDPRVQSIMPLLQSPKAPPSKFVGTPAGSLYFSTTVTSFIITMPQSHTDFRIRHVLDANHDACGFLQANTKGPSESDADRQMEPSELLILSVATYGIVSASQENIATFAPQYRQSQSEPEGDDLPGDYEFFNIMLVQSLGKTAIVERNEVKEEVQLFERVGLGILHMDAIRKASEPRLRLKEIVLV